ncbi:PREDICTED: uncharacterized protein LOC108517769 isoform X2 [Rhinopithecus bieti]|uniref:uncharacterized protein LOC108517769 isoform X2 n=1 Tax=Rhinopithecus bieti TaxID=61621 RepID=UPI00083C401E|nr:PREDICTED: uncharacterized protein LOC108517769 isoform X2 [Rhinopithecus bieti]
MSLLDRESHSLFPRLLSESRASHPDGFQGTSPAAGSASAWAFGNTAQRRRPSPLTFPFPRTAVRTRRNRTKAESGNSPSSRSTRRALDARALLGPLTFTPHPHPSRGLFVQSSAEPH